MMLPLATMAALVVSAAWAQSPATDTGTVDGFVHDADGIPLEGVLIYLPGVDDPVARTGPDGRYSLELPAGSHELFVMRAGFGTETVYDLVVASGGVTTAETTMIAEGQNLSEMTVTADRVAGGTATLLTERRDSTAVTDSIGAEQMARTGDTDAAAAVKRVPGLTVVGSKYVYVRGLGDRYSSTLLNGSTLPSPEPERRVVPLDLFPTALIEAVVIHKTPAAEQPGEMGGGIVAIRTRGLPDEAVATLSLSGAYTAGATFATAPTGAAGPTDWLGFGTAFRALPDEIAVASADEPLKAGGMFTEGGYSAEELEAFGELFPNRWAVTPRVLPPDFGLTGSVGNRWSLGGAEVGALAGLVWNNAWDVETGFKDVYSNTGSALEIKRHTEFIDATNKVRLGASLALGVEWGAGQEVVSTTLLNRSSTHQALVYSADDPSGSSDTENVRLAWEEQQLLFEQLATHLTLGSLALDARYAVAVASRDEPDQRSYAYINTEDGLAISQRGTWNEILYGALGERNHDLGLDLALPLRRPPVPGAPVPTIRAGGALGAKNREGSTRRFSYEFKGSEGIDLLLPIDEVLTPENIGASEEGDLGWLEIEEYTSNSDDYTASQRILAGYALADVPWTRRIRSVLGARVENARQEVSTFEQFDAERAPVNASLITTDVLPSASLIGAVGRDVEPDRMLVRLVYGRTLSRPELRELSEVPFYDYRTGRLFFGNPELRRATIDNVDVRWEWYPRPGESLSIGGFYKSFIDPIESVVAVSAVSGSVGTFDNAAAATNLGGEVDLRQRLDGIHPALAQLVVGANVSVIWSRVDLSETDGNQTSTARPLQGQSPYVANLQLGWEGADTGTDVSLLYHVFGARIAEVGTSGIPDTYELPVHRLDLVASQAFGEHWRARLKCTNLLDWPVRERTGEAISEEIREGWSVGVGLSWSR